MKLHKLAIWTLAALTLVGSCDDIDNQEPAGGNLTADQSKETNDEIPSRTSAAFAGMFSYLGAPDGVLKADRADDFGFIMAALSLDLEGADMTSSNNGYNWFSTASELSNRNPDYANPLIRYMVAYTTIGNANSVIDAIDPETTNPDLINQLAQSHAMRAFAYLSIAPYFQRGYSVAADSLCIPLLKSGTDYSNNPRATVKEVYQEILDNLNYAIEHLEGADRGGDKTRIDQNVAYGLRARAHLNMGMYAEAAADAEKAMVGYQPATREEMSTPAFCNLNEHNWMWGINITAEMTANYLYQTSSSWFSAFCGDGYGPACVCVPRINVLLYNKISSSDVRKNWWIDENCHSDNWTNLTWDAGDEGKATGDEIAKFTIENMKEPFLPYTNIKFGMKSGIGSATNDNDWPLMRVEEMILIQAEGLAKSGQEGRAKQVLENFVKTYRDPNYSVNDRGLTLENEIWFQRRVELWGEGFFMNDARRLKKNIVRFHDGKPTNVPDAFTFNIDINDPWLNMRFPTRETNSNAAIVNNTGGSQPVPGQNPNLRDGVTD